MNGLEMELWMKRAGKPIENWGKLLDSAWTTAGNEQLRYFREMVCGEAVLNLYDEVWEKPEKIVFFKNNVVSVTDLIPNDFGNLHLITDVIGPSNSSVITPDDVLSYIALREHGLRNRVRRIKSLRFNDALCLVAATKVLTKVLTLPGLLRVLEDNQTETNKALAINSLLKKHSPYLNDFVCDEFSGGEG